MALFKTKQTFHFEFEEIDNVNTTVVKLNAAFANLKKKSLFTLLSHFS